MAGCYLRYSARFPQILVGAYVALFWHILLSLVFFLEEGVISATLRNGSLPFGWAKLYEWENSSIASNTFKSRTIFEGLWVFG